MSRLIQDWQPENPEFWQNGGRKTARRNLWISIPALMLAFAVWQVWSVAVIHLPRIGFNYSPNQLFWLAAVPALSGATFRAFYSFMVPVFGGRRWTAFSTARRRSGHGHPKSRHLLRHHAAAGAVVRFGRR